MRGSRALFFILLLTTSALAGCAAPAANDGYAGDHDDGGDEGWNGGSDGSSTTDGGGAAPEDKLQSALKGLSIGQGPSRFLVHALIEENGRTTTHELFVDRPAGTSFYVVEESTDDDAFLFAQLGRTLLGGEPRTHLTAAREEGVAAFTTPQQLYHDHMMEHSVVGTSLYFDVDGMLMLVGYFSGWESQVSDVTHEGKSAKKIVLSGGITSTWIMDKDLKQVLWGQIVHSSSDGSGQTSTLTFRYDAEAAHAFQDPIARAATLAFQDKDGMQQERMGDEDASRSWTVRASESTQKVPLADVEFRLYGASGGASNPPILVVPLTAGAGENADAKLTFVDGDGDGYVSAGDTLSVEVLRPERTVYNYYVGLYDKTTEFLLLNR